MKLCQEPPVDIGYLPDFVNTITPVERSRYCEYSLVSWVD
jgi:hypothetical protein